MNNNNESDSTMNLFPIDDKNGCVGRTISLFPQTSAVDRPLFCGSKRVSTEPPTASMTIMFGGQVIVFEDMPCDKAKEVLDMASHFESSHKKRKLLEISNLAHNLTPKINPINPPYLNPNPNPNPNPASVPRSLMANPFYMPHARNASLHLFLKKRKDRLVGKAPSSLDSSGDAPSRLSESKSWLELASMPVSQAHQKQS